jgi:lysophospholipase L1-like esterase
MFGGSTTFGEGQRDEYTIASWLARLAEEAGTPIRIVNYGQRGWTHFQEMILFEQLAAAGPPPDVALFYDGANEINAQTLGAKGVPTHTLSDQYADLISGGLPEEFQAEEPTTPSLRDTLWDAYTEHSAVRMIVGRIRDALDPPAGATTAAPVQEDGPGTGTTYDKTVDDAVRALDVYTRGRDLTLFLTDRYDVEPLLFWQPVQKGPAEFWVDDNLTEPTVNISDALDAHPDVYIDGGHTNEEGARIVAERIWETLGPQVRSLGAGGD